MEAKEEYKHQNLLYHKDLTSQILGCCFEMMNELGVGFLESIYKNALLIALRQKNLKVDLEKTFQIYFRGHKIGIHRADIVVENSVIVELKCCKKLISEHQAQVINYLRATGIPVGLLINFGQPQLEYRRLYNPLLQNFIG